MYIHGTYYKQMYDRLGGCVIELKYMYVPTEITVLTVD